MCQGSRGVAGTHMHTRTRAKCTFQARARELKRVNRDVNMVACGLLVLIVGSRLRPLSDGIMLHPHSSPDSSTRAMHWRPSSPPPHTHAITFPSRDW